MVLFSDFIIAQDCLLKYDGDAFFYGSLGEPYSCIANAFNSMYHRATKTNKLLSGIKPGGAFAILAGTGPMGLAAIDYAINGPTKPSLLVVTDIDQERLKRARKVYSPEAALKLGVKVEYVNTSTAQGKQQLLNISPTGFDDIFVMAPVKQLIQDADSMLANDGCLNFFAGPTDTEFHAEINFYNIHYKATHVIGTAGGGVADMEECLSLMARKQLKPESMISHIGGLNCVAETTLNLPSIPGSRKLIYTHKDIELTSLDDFEEKGQNSEFFADLSAIVKSNNGLWCLEAEQYLLANAKDI